MKKWSIATFCAILMAIIAVLGFGWQMTSAAAAARDASIADEQLTRDTLKSHGESIFGLTSRVGALEVNQSADHALIQAATNDIRDLHVEQFGYSHIPPAPAAK